MLVYALVAIPGATMDLGLLWSIVGAGVGNGAGAKAGLIGEDAARNALL